jgi:Domain of unknown function (DUF1918)
MSPESTVTFASGAQSPRNVFLTWTQEADEMRAAVGDRLVIKGHHLGEPDRDAEVLEVHGKDGEPPWLVRWSDDGHEGLFFPGSDAVVEHLHHES